MKEEKKSLIATIALVVLAVVYTLLVKYFNVQNVGVNNTAIGFASLNTFIRDLIGQNDLWYTLSELFGLVALAMVGIYGLIGLYQLIKRKKIFAVDKEIIGLGVLYVVVIAIYILFDKAIIINYRPILEAGEIEASFPSSHTLLAVSICLSSLIANKRLLKEKTYKITSIFIYAVMALTIIGRTLSGVHWFTDIIGGFVIAAPIVKGYKTALMYLDKKEK